MAVKAPRWCKNAIPTKKGWTDPRTGEVLKCRRFSDDEIREFYDAQENSGATQVLTEAPANKDISDLTKNELVELGKQFGVDIDKRENKTSLFEKVQNLLS